MKRTLFVHAAAGACVLAAAPALALPLGQWARGDGNARVRIEPCGAALCAINTWIKDNSGGENVGDRLVMNVKPGADGALAGTAFDPQRNRTYAITIRYTPNSMTTRGCVLGVLCKSVSWSKTR